MTGSFPLSPIPSFPLSLFPSLPFSLYSPPPLPCYLLCCDSPRLTTPLYIATSPSYIFSNAFRLSPSSRPNTALQTFRPLQHCKPLLAFPRFQASLTRPSLLLARSLTRSPPSTPYSTFLFDFNWFLFCSSLSLIQSVSPSINSHLLRVILSPILVFPSYKTVASPLWCFLTPILSCKTPSKQQSRSSTSSSILPLLLLSSSSSPFSRLSFLPLHLPILALVATTTDGTPRSSFRNW